MTFQYFYLYLIAFFTILVSSIHLSSAWRKKKTLRNLITSLWILPVTTIILFLLPLLFVRTYLNERSIQPSLSLWKCLLTDRTSLCYLEAAKNAIIEKGFGEYDYTNAHAICQLAHKPESCQTVICNSLDRAESKETLDSIRAECFSQIVKPCQDGAITDQIPCGCEVRGRGYTAYTQHWYDTYWNKYRKLDRPPYCCDGKLSNYLCR